MKELEKQKHGHWKSHCAVRRERFKHFRLYNTSCCLGLGTPDSAGLYKPSDTCYHCRAESSGLQMSWIIRDSYFLLLVAGCSCCSFMPLAAKGNKSSEDQGFRKGSGKRAPGPPVTSAL